jgi:transcriptional regulator with XRE-family HTH domain
MTITTHDATSADHLSEHRTSGIERRRLGRQLRQFRQDKGLRLEDAANRLGVAASTLSRIETGRAPTRTSYLLLLMDMYGIAISSMCRHDTGFCVLGGVPIKTCVGRNLEWIRHVRVDQSLSEVRAIVRQG